MSSTAIMLDNQLQLFITTKLTEWEYNVETEQVTNIKL